MILAGHRDFGTCMLVVLVVSAARPGGPAAAARRPEILRLATAYELYGGLRRLTAAARGPTVYVTICEIFSVKEWCDLENRVRVRSRS